jgi:phosphoribosyl-ATP pyrophosphohydrolase
MSVERPIGRTDAPRRFDNIGGHESMPEPNILAALAEVIAQRKAHPPAGRSYVVQLLEGGAGKIRAKVVEEAAEVFEAAAEAGDEGRTHLVREVADLVFHLLVLLGHRDVPWSEVEAELTRRFGVSGLDEKESRRPGA